MSLRVSNNNGYTIGYDDGINYADGRVNTNSINYQSGYNSGISYADGRVNTSSTNYTTGYNNGINYADGRVNTSSTNYTTGYNNGINYADGRVNTSSSSYTNGYNSGRNSVTGVLKLTTGERWLMSIVGFRIGSLPDQAEHNETNEIIKMYICGSDLSFSSVSSVNIQCLEPENVYPWNCKFIVAVGGSQADFKDTSYGQVLTVYPSIGPVYVACSPGMNFVLNPKFVITSFTTKDGKVHTKDNLNY